MILCKCRCWTCYTLDMRFGRLRFWKWVAATGAGLTLAAWVFSYFCWIVYSDVMWLGRSYHLNSGVVESRSGNMIIGATFGGHYPKWSCFVVPTKMRRLDWRPAYYCRQQYVSALPKDQQLTAIPLSRRVVIPLWMAFVPLTAVTIVLFRKERIRRLVGHCRKCSYNLTGNTSGVCPECGTSIEN